ERLPKLKGSSMTDETNPTPADPQAQDAVPDAPIEPRPPHRRIGEIDGVRVELELHDKPEEL
ncbi:hypothetical protein LMP50_14000, partial [Staphylococcus aureus]|uniref:hypothetical protein n=1 Tax=Staphylococcus aureus TaxID=1280 RepID=UPI001E510005